MEEGNPKWPDDWVDSDSDDYLNTYLKWPFPEEPPTEIMIFANTSKTVSEEMLEKHFFKFREDEYMAVFMDGFRVGPKATYEKTISGLFYEFCLSDNNYAAQNRILYTEMAGFEDYDMMNRMKCLKTEKSEHTPHMVVNYKKDVFYIWDSIYGKKINN
jgi:hypothetical protein